MKSREFRFTSLVFAPGDFSTFHNRKWEPGRRSSISENWPLKHWKAHHAVCLVPTDGLGRSRSYAPIIARLINDDLKLWLRQECWNARSPNPHLCSRSRSTSQAMSVIISRNHASAGSMLNDAGHEGPPKCRSGDQVERRLCAVLMAAQNDDRSS